MRFLDELLLVLAHLGARSRNGPPLCRLVFAQGPLVDQVCDHVGLGHRVVGLVGSEWRSCLPLEWLYDVLLLGELHILSAVDLYHSLQLLLELLIVMIRPHKHFVQLLLLLLVVVWVRVTSCHLWLVTVVHFLRDFRSANMQCVSIVSAQFV